MSLNKCHRGHNSSMRLFSSFAPLREKLYRYSSLTFTPKNISRKSAKQSRKGAKKNWHTTKKRA
jgi:hypothetical protein